MSTGHPPFFHDWFMPYLWLSVAAHGPCNGPQQEAPDHNVWLLSWSTAAKAHSPMHSAAEGKGLMAYTSRVMRNTDARIRPTDAAFMPAGRKSVEQGFQLAATPGQAWRATVGRVLLKGLPSVTAGKTRLCKREEGAVAVQIMTATCRAPRLPAHLAQHTTITYYSIANLPAASCNRQPWLTTLVSRGTMGLGGC